MTYGQLETDRFKRKTKTSLFEIVAVFYIMHNALPIVGFYMPSVIYLGLFGLTFLLALPAFYRRTAYTMLGLFSVGLLAFINRLGQLSSALFYAYGELQTYLYGLIAIMVIRNNEPQRCRRMVILVLVMYAITAITTMIGNNIYPQASRYLATVPSTDFLYSVYVSENIGGFSFAYEIVLMVPLIIYLLREKTMNPIFCYGLLILFGATLIAMEYATALILYVASLLLIFIPKLNIRKLLVIMLVLLLTLFVLGDPLANLVDKISISVSSSTLSDRFTALAEALRGEDEFSSITAQTRIGLYSQAFQVFLDTNLLGGWGKIDTGGHSFILDTLGVYGLLGILALIFVFYTMYQVVIKPYGRMRIQPYLVWVYFLMVVLMIVNPKSYRFVVLFMIPLFGNMLEEKTEKIPRNT